MNWNLELNSQFLKDSRCDFMFVHQIFKPAILGIVVFLTTQIYCRLEAQDRWLTLHPDGAKAVFEMPTTPRVNEKEFVSPDKKHKTIIRLFNSITPDRQTSVVLSYYDTDQPLTNNKQRVQFLDSAANGTINKLLGATLKNEGSRFEVRHHLRDLIYLKSFKDKVHKIQTRLILVDQRLYNLSVVSPQDKFKTSLANRFFDSFRLVNDSYDLPPKPRRRK